MIKHNQNGAVSGLAVSFVLVILLLVGTIGFGVWAFSGRQDYKDNVDAKISTAVQVAKQQEGTRKDALFAQEEKNPLKTYNGPQAYGSMVVAYPKTWSGYVVDTSGASSGNLDAFFYPGVVPSTENNDSVFALRVQVLNQSYSQTVSSLSSPQSTQGKTTTVTPYALPKVPNVVGVKVDGELPNSKTGSMVVLPLRSQTLEIYTEGDQFKSDFNNIILPNFSFSP